MVCTRLLLCSIIQCCDQKRCASASLDSCRDSIYELQLQLHYLSEPYSQSLLIEFGVRDACYESPDVGALFEVAAFGFAE